MKWDLSLFHILPLVLLCAVLAGCGKQQNQGERERLSYPSLTIIPMAKSHQGEVVAQGNLDEMPFSQYRGAVCLQGVGTDGNLVLVSLFERRDDPDIPGNLLIKLEATVNNEAFDIPQVSWNRNEEIVLATGDHWMLLLTPYKMEEEQ